MSHDEEYPNDRRQTGWGRRDHDDNCEVNKKVMKEWVKDQICLATKPGKARVSILIILLGSTLALSGIAVVNSFAINGDVDHNHERIGEIAEEHGILKEDVGDIKEDIGNIEGYMKQQTQIMKALAREHEIEVDIE